MATRDYNSIQLSQKLLTQIFSRIVPIDMGYKTPCWVVTTQDGTPRPSQYAVISVAGKDYRFHRLMHTLFIAPIPEILECDHMCNIRGCVNPSHLQALTHCENTLRSNNPLAHNARKTHCPQGHTYTPDNLVQGKGRVCKTCLRLRSTAKNRQKGIMPKRDNSIKCRFGHLYTPETLYINPRGVNCCRICSRRRNQQYQQRKTLNKSASNL